MQQLGRAGILNALSRPMPIKMKEQIINNTICMFLARCSNGYSDNRNQ